MLFNLNSRLTMKKLMLLFLTISSDVAGQLFYKNGPDNVGGMIISPSGIINEKPSSSSILHFSNSAFGWNALSHSSSGEYNTAIGSHSLSLNGSGNNNTAMGNFSLSSNYNGNYNTAIGSMALYVNSFGSNNTCVGDMSLGSNIAGNNNTAVGAHALRGLHNGDNNTAYGYRTGASLDNPEPQYNNTFIGAYADVASTFDPHNPIANATAIGYRAGVDASNKVRIGNDQVTAIEGQVPWSNPSDRRLKENISYTSRLGLDFITRLQTVSYNYIADQHKTRYDGFIAQDVEKVMKDLGVPFSGLKKSADGTYSLAYSDFVMPLVNAVKEQQAKIERLEKQNQALQANLAEIQEIKQSLPGCELQIVK